jgi:hypothetical protein
MILGVDWHMSLVCSINGFKKNGRRMGTLYQ